MDEITDWRTYARSEVVAILSEVGWPSSVASENLVNLMAAAWLQGCNYGSHRTLAAAEETFERMKEGLS